MFPKPDVAGSNPAEDTAEGLSSVACVLAVDVRQGLNINRGNHGTIGFDGAEATGASPPWSSPTVSGNSTKQPGPPAQP